MWPAANWTQTQIKALVDIPEVSEQLDEEQIEVYEAVDAQDNERYLYSEVMGKTKKYLNVLSSAQKMSKNSVRPLVGYLEFNLQQVTQGLDIQSGPNIRNPEKPKRKGRKEKVMRKEIGKKSKKSKK